MHNRIQFPMRVPQHTYVSFTNMSGHCESANKLDHNTTWCWCCCLTWASLPMRVCILEGFHQAKHLTYTPAHIFIIHLDRPVACTSCYAQRGCTSFLLCARYVAIMQSRNATSDNKMGSIGETHICLTPVLKILNLLLWPAMVQVDQWPT